MTIDVHRHVHICISACAKFHQCGCACLRIQIWISAPWAYTSEVMGIIVLIIISMHHALENVHYLIYRSNPSAQAVSLGHPLLSAAYDHGFGEGKFRFPSESIFSCFFLPLILSESTHCLRIRVPNSLLFLCCLITFKKKCVHNNVFP